MDEKMKYVGERNRKDEYCLHRGNLHSGGVFELDRIAALVEANLNWSRVDPILVDAC